MAKVKPAPSFGAISRGLANSLPWSTVQVWTRSRIGPRRRVSAAVTAAAVWPSTHSRTVNFEPPGVSRQGSCPAPNRRPGSSRPPPKAAPQGRPGPGSGRVRHDDRRARSASCPDVAGTGTASLRPADQPAHTGRSTPCPPSLRPAAGTGPRSVPGSPPSRSRSSTAAPRSGVLFRGTAEASWRRAISRLDRPPPMQPGVNRASFGMGQVVVAYGHDNPPLVRNRDGCPSSGPPQAFHLTSQRLRGCCTSHWKGGKIAKQRGWPLSNKCSPKRPVLG